jgi:hypothetical protein
MLVQIDQIIKYQNISFEVKRMGKKDSFALQFFGCVSYPLDQTFTLQSVDPQQLDSFYKDLRVDHFLGQEYTHETSVFFPVSRKLAGRKIVSFKAPTRVAPGYYFVGNGRHSMFPTLWKNCGLFYRQTVYVETVRLVKKGQLS